MSSKSATLSVWSEFLSYAEVRKHLPRLAELGCGLFLAVRREAFGDEDFFALWKEALDRGIEIRPWILLPLEDGYWPNAWNIPQTEKLALDLVSALAQRGLRTGWMTFDLEPPPSLLLGILHELRGRRPLAAWNRLREAHRAGRETQLKARAGLVRLVDSLRALGIRSHAVTNPVALNDLETGTDSFQCAFGTPLAGIEWDDVSFMVYRPEYRKILGKVGSDLVYAYAARAARHFGERASIDLGEVGKISFPEPTRGFEKPEELHADFAAARAAGITRFHVYALDQLILEPEPARWLALPRARRPGHDVRARAFLFVLDQMARLLG